MVIDCVGGIWNACGGRGHVNVDALRNANEIACFVLAAIFCFRIRKNGISALETRQKWKLEIERNCDLLYSPPTRSDCDVLTLIACCASSGSGYANDANVSAILNASTANVISTEIWFEFVAAAPPLASLWTIKCQWLDQSLPKSYFVLLSQWTWLLRFLAGPPHCSSLPVW